MSRRTVAAAVVVVLVALLGWQWSRERTIEACRREGGLWDGASSVCLPAPARPILRRGIERSVLTGVMAATVWRVLPGGSLSKS